MPGTLTLTRNRLRAAVLLLAFGLLLATSASSDINELARDQKDDVLNQRCCGGCCRAREDD